MALLKFRKIKYSDLINIYSNPNSFDENTLYIIEADIISETYIKPTTLMMVGKKIVGDLIFERNIKAVTKNFCPVPKVLGKTNLGSRFVGYEITLTDNSSLDKGEVLETKRTNFKDSGSTNLTFSNGVVIQMSSTSDYYYLKGTAGGEEDSYHISVKAILG